MKVFNLLRNLWQRAKSYSDSNLQTAKDYTDTSLEIGAYQYTMTSGTLTENRAFTICGIAMGTIAFNISCSAYTWKDVATTPFKPSEEMYFSVFSRYDATYIGMINIRPSGVIRIDSTKNITNQPMASMICYRYVGGGNT